MTNKFKISDISFDYPPDREIDNWEGLMVKTYLPLEEKLNLIERVMNMCAGNGTFCNPVKVQVITDLEIVMTYSNIEIDQELLSEDIYKIYDYLNVTGLMESILFHIDEKELSYIRSACWETSEKLTNFNNSLMGALHKMNEEAAFTNLNMDEILDKIKDPALGEFVKNFANINNIDVD